MNPIAKLEDFSRVDRQKTILLLVWEAREYLSDAERGKEIHFRTRIDACTEAHRLLEAAIVLSKPVSASAQRVHDLLRRSLFASSAAAENGEIAASYALAAASMTANDWEKQHAPKAVAIFERAAETARRETHRALADLCELFPDALPKE